MMPIVRVPPPRRILLDSIQKQTGQRCGVWDVYCWNDERVLFAELKRGGRDRIRSSQRRFLEAALNEKLPLDAFLVVEWHLDTSEEIFQEIPDGIDETWRHGVLLGGMADLAFRRKAELAVSYKRAGDALVAAVLHGGEASELAYPILFNYRHSLELYLKAIVEPAKRDHAFSDLVGQFQSAILTLLNVPVPNWVIDRLLEFQDVDDRSTTFRYPEKGVAFPSGRLSDEVWVDLQRLRDVMNRLAAMFAKVLEQLPTKA